MGFRAKRFLGLNEHEPAPQASEAAENVWWVLRRGDLLTQDDQAVRYEPEWLGDESPQDRAPEPIGRILARTRAELGYDLATVAAELRIRQPYLEAIEAGRYNDLPGMPYAIGFVRSYAEYLGLDSDATVALFKTEVSDLAREKQELSFPAPKPEGRLPGGALILISLLLVALAYGGWYLWNQSGRPFVELLPFPDGEESVQVAEDTGGAGDRNALEEEPTEEDRGTGVDSGPEGLSEPDSPPEPLTGEDTALDSSAAEVAEPDGPGAEGGDTPLAGAGEQSGAADSPAPLGDTPLTEQAEEEEADIPAPPQPADLAEEEPADQEAEEPADQQQEAAADAATEEAALDMANLGDGEVYGEEGAGVRVVLLATADSWVQVRGSDDELLFTRVLRPGDTYRVPNEAGLTLLTGNAGGLDIVVDGQRLPSLGPQGAVRRNISLDVEALRSSLE